MMLKDIIDSPCGLRYCFESLPLQSGCSRKRLLEQEMMLSRSEISACHAHIKKYISFIGAVDPAILSSLRFHLQGLKDISGTIDRLGRSANLDDIELFEVKTLSMLALEVNDILQKNGFDGILGMNPVLTAEVVSILDPDGLKIASFYVYDSYSPDLAALRLKLKSATSEEERQKLTTDSQMMEVAIRKKISDSLKPYTDTLTAVLLALAETDIALAKASMMLDMHLVFPEISETGATSYQGVFHPEIHDILQKQGRSFQNVDISLGKEAVLIIGANMGGKTVVLKTLALCQYLCQYGFGIPARKAEITLQNEIFLVCGDAQDEKEGLSSFAAEMKGIDAIIRAAEMEDGKRIMALIDEPARSTNPIEGTALVTALLKVLQKGQVTLAVTTHYDVSSDGSRRLKVRGMENGKMNYELCDSPLGEVPQEALEVAESLNISPSWLEEAKKVLKCKVN